MVVDRINIYLSSQQKTLNDSIRYEIEKMAGWAFKRQFMTEEGSDTAGKLRLSSAGGCPRKLAYAYHGYEKNGKEIDSRAKIVFWTGDLVEFTIVALARLAGVNILATGFNQLSVKANIEGVEVEGHPDGLILNGGLHLLEVKSMSSYGFEKFEKGEIGETYIAQINMYMDCLGLDKCIFVALNKDAGVLGEKIITRDENIIKKTKENIIKVLKSTKDNLPEPPREYAPNDKGFYPWQCRFCPYFKLCRTNAELVLCGKSYKLKVKKEVKI